MFFDKSEFIVGTVFKKTVKHNVFGTVSRLWDPRRLLGASWVPPGRLLVVCWVPPPSYSIPKEYIYASPAPGWRTKFLCAGALVRDGRVAPV